MEQQKESTAQINTDYKKRTREALRQQIFQSSHIVAVQQIQPPENLQQEVLHNQRIEQLFCVAKRTNDSSLWRLLGQLLYSGCMRHDSIKAIITYIEQHEELQKIVLGVYMQKHPWLYSHVRLSLVRKSGKNPIAFCPEDQTIAFGSPYDIFRLLNTLTNEQKPPFYTYNDDDHDGDDDYCFALSHDCSVLAAAGKRGDKHVITLWDIYSGSMIRQLIDHPRCINSIVFSPDGKTIATVHEDGGIRVWDSSSGERKYALKATNIAFHPNNIFAAIIALDGSIQLINTQEKASMPFDCPAVGYAQFESILFSPDGNVFAATDKHRNSIQLWDVQSGMKTHTLTGHTLPISSIAFSPDSSLLLSGARDGTIRLWDLKTGGQVYYGLYDHPIRFVNFNHSGSQIVAEGDGSIYLYGFTSLSEVLMHP
jgi:sugar lactone lactonase YvrE